MIPLPMTSLERIQAAISFQPPDVLPCHEMYWDDSLSDWQEQGLSVGVSPADCFGLDVAWMFLDTSPQCPQRELRRDGEFVTYEDRYGCTIRKPIGKSGSLEFLDHVTKDRSTWETVKSRLTLSSDHANPARIDDASYFAHMQPYPDWETAREKFQLVRSQQRYTLFRAYGPWNAAWRHRGME
jgi:hypothetical protein